MTQEYCFHNNTLSYLNCSRHPTEDFLYYADVLYNEAPTYIRKVEGTGHGEASGAVPFIRLEEYESENLTGAAGLVISGSGEKYRAIDERSEASR